MEFQLLVFDKYPENVNFPEEIVEYVWQWSQMQKKKKKKRGNWMKVFLRKSNIE